MRYRAHIDIRPWFNEFALFLMRNNGDRTEVWSHEPGLRGRWVEHQPGTELPIEAAMIFPLDTLDAVAEVFHPHAGAAVEASVLREALQVERDRVDRILGQR